MNLLTLCKVGSACVLPDKWFYDLVCGNFKGWYYITVTLPVRELFVPVGVVENVAVGFDGVVGEFGRQRQRDVVRVG